VVFSTRSVTPVEIHRRKVRRTGFRHFLKRTEKLFILNKL